MKAMRVHVLKSKTRINLDSNEDNNDKKDNDDDYDGNDDDDNNGSDDKYSGGGGGDVDDNDNEWNNFLFKGINYIDLVSPLSHFTGETTFIQCTQDEDHMCKGVGTGIGAIRKDFIRRNREGFYKEK